MTSKMLNFMKSASKWASSVCEEQCLPQTSSLWTIKYYENTSELYFLCGVLQNVFLQAVAILFPWLHGLSSYCAFFMRKLEWIYPGVCLGQK